MQTFTVKVSMATLPVELSSVLRDSGAISPGAARTVIAQGKVSIKGVVQEQGAKITSVDQNEVQIGQSKLILLDFVF